MATYASKLDRVSPENFVTNLSRSGLSPTAGMGKVFYVCPTDSACYSHWLETVGFSLYTTVKDAYDATVTGRNDVIVLSPDAHVIATPYMLTVSKNCVHFIGAGVGNRRIGQRARIDVNTDSGSSSYPGVIKVTGVGCSFNGIKFRNNVATIVESKNVLIDAGEYTLYENCDFYIAALAQATTTGIAEIVANGDSSQFINCSIGSSANQLATTDLTRPCVLITGGTVTGGKLRDNIFENCIFQRKAGHTSNAFIYGANATDVERMLLLKDCTFLNSTLASADPAAAVVVGSAQTEGSILMRGCTSCNCTLLKTASVGIFVDPATATYSAVGKAITS